MKTKLFTVGGNDLKWDTFRCGGKGGQNVNKRDTGARVTHLPTGIACEGREERSQEQNKRSALRKLSEHPRFILWCLVSLKGRSNNTWAYPVLDATMQIIDRATRKPRTKRT